MKAGMICCSNGLNRKNEEQLEKLKERLKDFDIDVIFSPYLYRTDHIRSADASLRAKIFNDMNKDDSIDIIFDLSGGDIANEILEDIDYHSISKPLCGYSDLTTILNAVYTKTKQPCILYQIRHLNNEIQYTYWKEKTLFDLSYQFLNKTYMKGIVVGGNIRCFLKLAGTPYFPNVQNKILLLEAMSGNEAKIITYFSQLKQMGVFHKINGLLLGTYSEYFKNHDIHDLYNLIKRYLPDNLCVAYTKDIGHGKDAKALWIGKEYEFLLE